jgi:hypothetical protein
LARCHRACGLSAFIVLLMLRSMVVTNAIVLRDLAVLTNAIVLRDRAQHKIEAGADVHTELLQGGRTHVCRILMTATATILVLIPLALSSDDGLIAASLATVVIGGLLSSMLLTLVVIPVISRRSKASWRGCSEAAPAAVASLLLLEAVRDELERARVLRDRADHVVRSPLGDVRCDVQRHLDARPAQRHQVLHDLLRDAAGVAPQALRVQPHRAVVAAQHGLDWLDNGPRYRRTPPTMTRCRRLRDFLRSRACDRRGCLFRHFVLLLLSAGYVRLDKDAQLVEMQSAGQGGLAKDEALVAAGWRDARGVAEVVAAAQPRGDGLQQHLLILQAEQVAIGAQTGTPTAS